MKNNIDQRIRKIIDSLGISDRTFSSKINIPQTTLSGVLLGKTVASLKLIQSILIEFPLISTEWLINGQGDMLKQQEPNREANLHSRNTYRNDGDITIGATANESLVTYATAAGGNSSNCEKKLSEALIEIKHLREIIESKDNLLAEKERLICVLMDR